MYPEEPPPIWKSLSPGASGAACPETTMPPREDIPGGALTVTELTRARWKTLLEDAFPEVWVRGEVSNLRIQSSGHAYFTLKDSGAQLSAVMFRGDLLRAEGALRDGAQVAAFGRVSVYEPRGAYQLVVRVALDDGLDGSGGNSRR